MEKDQGSGCAWRRAGREGGRRSPRLEALSLRFALIAGLIFGGAGCLGKRGAGNVYQDPAIDLDLVQSAAVLPFVNLTNEDKAGDRVRDVFSTMLQATGRVYVVPPGEVAKALSRTQSPRGEEPTTDTVTAIGKAVQSEVVITGALLEYGAVRSGNSQANVIAMNVKMYESENGKLIWSGSTTAGGITAGDRFFGGGGEPMEIVTEKGIRDLLGKMFK
jgi:hypothetical protein